jgi:aspartate ammonia-lyase
VSIRIEKDLLGERAVPAGAYYGIHTLRAMENFRISGVAISQHGALIRAIAAVKQAAAEANAELGLLEQGKRDAIVRACEEIRAGELHDQFRVDVLQGGAGTSTNMNANEVITNRALEHLGRERGDYAGLHPLDDVNLCQSTNDVYPTAVRVALHERALALISALAELRRDFDTKASEFADALTVGRTQLQDAVPLTLGQMFRACAVTIAEDEERLAEASRLLREINLGATAIGTGINTPVRYAEVVRGHLSRITGIALVTAPDLIEATQDAGAFVQLSGVLKRVAVKLSKLCSDLRLLSSGPRAGFGEIALPAVQAGSSIMPGKVNPVIPEVVNQVAFEVIGNDVTITFAAESGQLQLNAFEPVIAHRLLEGFDHLRAAVVTLAERCVRGITADRDRLRRTVEVSAGLATALSPHVGYARATLIAREALETGRTVHELVLEKGWMTPEQLDVVLHPATLSRPSLATGPA